LIPKKIFYAWFGNAPYPEEFLKNKQTWIKFNPEYQIVELNESNFDISMYTFSEQMYEKQQWAFVSDVARIWAVNEFGGIYLDTDVEVLKPFDNLIKNSQFWAKEDIGMVNSGLIFGSEKNSIILKEILQKYSQIENVTIDKLALFSTVRIVSEILVEFGLTNTKKTDSIPDNIMIYKTDLFAPLHYWGGGSIKQESITVHHYSASWVGNNNGSKARLAFRYFIHQLMFYSPLLNVAFRKSIDFIKLRRIHE
jgi:hypothetical protein